MNSRQPLAGIYEFITGDIEPVLSGVLDLHGVPTGWKRNLDYKARRTICIR